ncbi:uncharacterized protein LOC115918154 isoform X2 [Strongylocentrotus purpuratus]|uniref:Uncharacterized protein n=1 Tax=Strongylocentrotus purpuratus TaxID=7668 RepID=A0A7M7NWU2_STRPU|nr:uncharacterized protein LOC115918154 isoform X2 [Strongylocentrotus purpuratus]
MCSKQQQEQRMCTLSYYTRPALKVRYQPLETVDEVFNDDVLLLTKRNDTQKKCRSKKSCLSSSDIQNERLLLRPVPAVPRPPGTSLQLRTPQNPSQQSVTSRLVIPLMLALIWSSITLSIRFEVTVTSSGVVIYRENPVLTGYPTDIVANASPGTSTPVVSWLAPVASDN